MKFNKVTKGMLAVLLLTLGAAIHGQQAETVIKGRVLDARNKKPIPFAVIASPGARAKTRANESGSFELQLPSLPQEIIVQAPGYRFQTKTVQQNTNKIIEISLERIKVKGAVITIKDEREIQKVSRYTMTAQEMKDVPASFGDSISALTALAGINRTSGFFGNLTIRGLNSNFNRYYIDDIPMYSILHFGGLHSVINTNLIKQIDVYSSAYPARFSGGLGALISIETIDDVKSFYGIADINVISSNALLAGPFTRAIPNDSNTSENPEPRKEFLGYWIASGRYGNLSIAKAIADLLNEPIDNLPIYYDYQAKGKYFLSKNHSLTLFLFGSGDFLEVVSETKPEDIAEGADPLFNDIQFRTNNQFHNQSLSYLYAPSKRLSHKVLLFSSLNTINNFAFRANSFLDADYVSRPNIYGIRDITRVEYWPDTAQLEVIAEGTYYDFYSRGKTIVPSQPRVGFNLGDKNAFITVPVDVDGPNKTLGGSLTNRFKFGILTLAPAVRADYLSLTKKTTVDPRGLISLEFPTGTTVSAAGGQYTSFVQINPFLFVTSPNFSREVLFAPEKAYHSAFGVEQEFWDLYSAKLELFYNTFTDLLVPSGNNLGQNSGKAKAYGAEITFRKDTTSARDAEFFGWLSYTYTQSVTKSGLASDPAGNEYVRNRYEQEHVVKLVGGYLLGPHSFTAKFQLYTSFPYTPIIGDDGNALNFTPARYGPVYDRSNPYSKHFPPSHRLDLRYSYETSYSWGSVQFYIEVINVYAFAPVLNEKWKYNQPYQPGVNPTLEKDTGIASIPLPNLGVEVRF